MTLYDMYNASLNELYNGSIINAVTMTYEAAFYGMWPYYLLFATVMILVYIKSRNMGLLGIAAGCLGEGLVLLGKFPAYFHIAAYIIIGLSVGLSLYLFFTEKNVQT